MVRDEIKHLAREMVCEFVDQDAKAVLLTGSYVRGDPYPESDVDLMIVREDQEGRLHLRGGHLVSIYWRSPDSIRKLFLDPYEAGGIIQQ